MLFSSFGMRFFGNFCLCTLNEKAKVTLLCLTHCDPMDCIFHGILQDIILEWYPFSSPEELPNPGTERRAPTLQVDSLPTEPSFTFTIRIALV